MQDPHLAPCAALSHTWSYAETLLQGLFCLVCRHWQLVRCTISFSILGSSTTSHSFACSFFSIRSDTHSIPAATPLQHHPYFPSRSSFCHIGHIADSTIRAAFFGAFHLPCLGPANPRGQTAEVVTWLSRDLLQVPSSQALLQSQGLALLQGSKFYCQISLAEPNCSKQGMQTSSVCGKTTMRYLVFLLV